MSEQCRDKLEVLKYKDVIDKQRRSSAGVESEEEGTQVDVQLITQLHRVLGGRAVVNPPQLLKIVMRESPASSDSALAQPFLSRLLSSRPSTPKEPTPLPPAMQEVEEEETQES